MSGSDGEKGKDEERRRGRGEGAGVPFMRYPGTPSYIEAGERGEEAGKAPDAEPSSSAGTSGTRQRGRVRDMPEAFRRDRERKADRTTGGEGGLSQAVTKEELEEFSRAMREECEKTQAKRRKRTKDEGGDTPR